MREIVVTCFETEDGERFFDKKKATLHEAEMNNKKSADEVFEKYRIPDPKNELRMPRFLHGDTPRLMDMGYEWYLVNSKADADELLGAFFLVDISVRRLPESYPSVFGYNKDRRSQFWLSDLETLSKEAVDFVEKLKSASKSMLKGEKDNLQKPA